MKNAALVASAMVAAISLATVATAQANVETIFKQHAMDDITVTGKPLTLPQVPLIDGGQGIDSLRRDLAKPLAILMAIVFLVALIACANVANLLLARAAVSSASAAARCSSPASSTSARVVSATKCSGTCSSAAKSRRLVSGARSSRAAASAARSARVALSSL